MSQETGHFWIRNHMKTDVVWNPIFPESGCCLFGSVYPFVRDNNIHSVTGATKVLDNVGSMLLHASQHKRVNSVRDKYNVQSACNLPQLAR